MPAKKIDFNTVRTLALHLPGVEESTVYGSPALKVHGDLLACIPTHKSAEPGTLAVRIEMERRAEMVATSPEIYYLTEHYRNYPVVLVRMAHIGHDALQDLLKMSWRFVTARPSKPAIRKRARPAE